MFAPTLGGERRLIVDLRREHPDSAVPRTYTDDTRAHSSVGPEAYERSHPSGLPTHSRMPLGLVVGQGGLAGYLGFT